MSPLRPTTFVQRPRVEARFFLLLCRDDQLFKHIKSCRMESANVTHCILLEVMEISRAHHTSHRCISDENRLAELRAALSPVPVDVMWITVAATHQASSHSDDQYFEKCAGGLYQVRDCRRRLAAASRALPRGDEDFAGGTPG